jgi:putative Holliday junction resolvase
MGRYLGIDYGLQRTGIAVTDPNQIIVTGLDTMPTSSLLPFLIQYVKQESVVAFVVGHPFLDGAWGNKAFREKLEAFIAELKRIFPTIPVHLQDERFSSSRAKEIILQSGKNKKQRRDRSLLDKMSAVVILQEYLGHI